MYMEVVLQNFEHNVMLYRSSYCTKDVILKEDKVRRQFTVRLLLC